MCGAKTSLRASIDCNLEGGGIDRGDGIRSLTSYAAQKAFPQFSDALIWLLYVLIINTSSSGFIFPLWFSPHALPQCLHRATDQRGRQQFVDWSNQISFNSCLSSLSSAGAPLLYAHKLSQTTLYTSYPFRTSEYNIQIKHMPSRSQMLRTSDFWNSPIVPMYTTLPTGGGRHSGGSHGLDNFGFGLMRTSFIILSAPSYFLRKNKQVRLERIFWDFSFFSPTWQCFFRQTCNKNAQFYNN